MAKPKTLSSLFPDTHCIFSFTIIVFLFFFHGSEAQPNITGNTCTNTNASIDPCQTYLLYRATSPDFLDLAAIADLFAVSRLMISKPSNISSPESPLIPGQTVFVPISCACRSVNDNGTRRAISFANVSHTIEAGDTYYALSTGAFQNLTTYQSVMVVNPELVATNLTIGVEVVFPIFCKCPTAAQATKGMSYLVSYAFQPSDTLASVASFFNASTQSIVEVNGNNINPADTIFVPVNKLPVLSQPIVVSDSSTPTNDDRKGVVSGLAAGLGVTGLLLVLVCGIWGYRERVMREKRGSFYIGDEEKQKVQTRIKNNNNMNGKAREMEESLMADVSGCLDKYRVFGIDELEEATNGFHDNCVVQGSVYKGIIDGEVYAIKKMNWDACEELKILQKVNHGNLVKLEGFCIDASTASCFLIYEYVENGSLDTWLQGGQKLSWKARLRIAVDVANGLQYIHEHTRPRVVHKDVKSSNVLLDASLRAKIANFGLAKSGFNAITTRIVGTQGYIAPEYLADGVVSTKMDVFSYGVVLLELISGKEVIGERGEALWAEAGRVMEGSEEERSAKLRDWMDRDLLGDTCSMESVTGVMAVAVACVSRDPAKRPGMVDIVYMLCKSDDLFYDISDDALSGSQSQVIGR